MPVTWIIAALLLSTPAASFTIDDEAALTLDVTPQAAVSPATIRVTARIVRDDANRRLTISADSPVFYRSSSISLEGSESVGALSRVFERLPAGAYVVKATLERNDGTTIVEQLDLKIIGRKN
jgi:hypothetical protein